MPDRPEGATYISNPIEMVVHRVVKTNDNRGIYEHLIEETSNIYIIYIYIYIYRQKSKSYTFHHHHHHPEFGEKTNISAKSYSTN